MSPKHKSGHCPKHPKVRLRCPACTGARGGRVLSQKKTRAAKKNVREALRARGVI